MGRWKKERHTEKMTINAMVANSGRQHNKRKADCLVYQKKANTEAMWKSLVYLEQQLYIQFREETG